MNMQKIGHWCLDSALALMHFGGQVLMGIGVIAILFFVGAIHEERIEASGHYDAWFYRQACPNAEHEEFQARQLNFNAGKPVDPSRDPLFYESCLKEVKHS